MSERSQEKTQVPKHCISKNKEWSEHTCRSDVLCLNLTCNLFFTHAHCAASVFCNQALGEETDRRDKKEPINTSNIPISLLLSRHKATSYAIAYTHIGEKLNIHVLEQSRTHQGCRILTKITCFVLNIASPKINASQFLQLPHLL